MRLKRVLGRAAYGLQLLLSALLACILCLNLYFLLAKKAFGVSNPTLFGYQSAVVLTGSMSGTIEPDDLIVTKQQLSYAVGDVITFQSGAATVTHRIVALEPGGYRTRGDANNTDDPGAAVTEGDVIGRVVWVIPHIGAVIRFVSSPAGLLCLLLITVLLIESPTLIRRLRLERGKSVCDKTLL